MKVCHSVADAKEMWCPMASSDESSTKCLADQCMAWKWVRTHVQDDNVHGLKESTDTHGVCGLTVQPTNTFGQTP